MIRPIVTEVTPSRESAVLHQKTLPVVTSKDSRPWLESLLQDMRDTLMAHPVCIGLSANQIGVPLAVSIINLERSTDTEIVLINPRVVSTSGKLDSKYEACMSLPGYRGKVRSRKILEVSYTNSELREECVKFVGFAARAARHEIDHLNGVVFNELLEGDAELEETSLFDYQQPVAVDFRKSEIIEMCARLTIAV